MAKAGRQPAAAQRTGDVSGSGAQRGGGRAHTPAGAGHLPCTIPRILTPSHPGQGRRLDPLPQGSNGGSGPATLRKGGRARPST